MIRQAGIDTWSVCWYLGENSPARRAMEALATEPGPRSRLLPEPVDDHRVGWFPGSRMLFAEGHPSQDGLCSPERLPQVLAALSEALQDRGILPPRHKLQPLWRPGRDDDGNFAKVNLPVLGGTGFGGIRRLDSTVDIEFADPREGLAALAGVAALPVPRSKTQIVREVGGRRVETVYFRGASGKRVLGRWYDKGVESGLAARGLLVRPEDQRRFPKDSRLDVDSVASSGYVRDSFVRRFQPLWQASKGVKVAAPTDLALRVRELIEEGHMTPAEGKVALGHLMLDSVECTERQSTRTYYRDRSICRRNGLVLADGVLDEVEVDLQDVISEALEADCWGRG